MIFFTTFTFFMTYSSLSLDLTEHTKAVFPKVNGNLTQGAG